jgi:3-hydroxybutyrate dehydrogenase
VNQPRCGRRVAVVTGSEGALGSALCEALRLDGIQVVGVDLAEGADIRADVSTADGNESMVAAAVERYGRLDILVLNAGAQHVETFPEFSLASWDELQALMCRGPFIAIKAAWSHLIASEHGRIVVIASTNAIAAEPHKVAYNSSKAGVVGVVRTAALEGGQHGLTANAVAPGWMLTPMVEQRLADYMSVENSTRGDVIDRMLSRMPVKRFIAPAEVAAVVRFLTTPEAGAINGVLLPVDLGLLAC